MYYAISKNKIAHIVKPGNTKTECDQKIRPEWAKYTKTTESRCENCAKNKS